MWRFRSGLSAWLLLGAWLLSSSPAEGRRPPSASLLQDPVFTTQLRIGLDHLYDVETREAREVFERLGRLYPGHPVLPLLEAQLLWWHILLDPQDHSRDERLQARLERAIAGSDRRLERDPRDLDGRYVRATAMALRGRLRSLRGDWIAAAWDAKRSLDLVRQLAREQPGNEDVGFALGIYDYFADVAPERYPVLKALKPFFPSGDRQRGLAALERASRHGQLARTEAAYFLLQIHYHFEEDPRRSLEQARWLRQQHPKNPLFHLFEGRIHSRWGRTEKAVPILQDVLRRYARQESGYGEGIAEEALYHLVRCAMRNRDYGAAGAYLDRLEAMAANRTSGVLTLVHLRRGMVLDARGIRPAAVGHYQRTLNLPDSGEAHALARKFLRSPYPG
ncbi:MAG TPA: tetratricopeptide repeat protein [Thermoanaerobaculia bacterium]|nr:tetratricopeptide repeat protein [Thermoanaerobaculia bacterium]